MNSIGLLNNIILKNVSSGKESSAWSTHDTISCDGLYLSRYAGDNRGCTGGVQQL